MYFIAINSFLMNQGHLAQVVQKVDNASHQALVVQRLDNAIHWINQYSAEKCRQKKPSYPLDSDLSSGQHYPLFEQLRPDKSLSSREHFFTE